MGTMPTEPTCVEEVEPYNGVYTHLGGMVPGPMPCKAVQDKGVTFAGSSVPYLKWGNQDDMCFCDDKQEGTQCTYTEFNGADGIAFDTFARSLPTKERILHTSRMLGAHRSQREHVCDTLAIKHAHGKPPVTFFKTKGGCPETR